MSTARLVVDGLRSLDSVFNDANEVRKARAEKLASDDEKLAFASAWGAYSEHERKGRKVDAAFDEAWVNYVKAERRKPAGIVGPVQPHALYTLIAKAIHIFAQQGRSPNPELMRGFDPA